MFVMLLIYLVALGLNIWFSPKVVAIVSECNIRAEIKTVHALSGFLLGLVPALNIIFLFFGARLLVHVDQLLKAEHPGAEAEIKAFNKRLKDLKDEEQQN
jgi:hypothetical protein